MVYTFRTIPEWNGLGLGPSSMMLLMTFSENKTNQKITPDPSICTFWWTNIVKDTPEKLINILLRPYPEISPGIPASQRERKSLKTKDTWCALIGACPCLVSLAVFPLNSKGPHKTCNQRSNGQWQLVLGWPMTPFLWLHSEPVHPSLVSRLLLPLS